jgi:hypothetical protein
MNRNFLFLSVTLAGFLGVSMAALAGKPLQAEIVLPYDPLVDQAGNPIDPVAQPHAGLFAASCMQFFQQPNPPILARDRHQITAAEWMQATGRATAQCTPQGTLINVHLSGLIPGGVYTAWVVTFAAPGFDSWLWTYVKGIGALGAQDGSQNVLHVSASGEAQLTVFQPATALSELGEVSNCLFDEYQFQIVILYHLDFTTYGPHAAADPCLVAEQIGFTFTP